MRLKRVVIQRGKWLRGKCRGCLLDGHGMMCCLGFDAQQTHGKTGEDLLYHTLPSKVGIKDWIRHGGHDFEARVAAVNDDNGLTDEERESQLAQMFAEVGRDLVFEG